MLKRGFTLVELLIVIALLGALAIGLIGALDPLEQIKKGTDTGTRDTTTQMHEAILRYYAVKGYMPWCTAPATCNPFPGTSPNFTAANLSTAPMVAAVTAMVTAGELKSTFASMKSGDLTKVYVFGDATTSDVTVCYHPTSKSFKADDNTKYDPQGVVDADCATTDVCYWCIK